MIRIYDKYRDDKINHNLRYTTNYNLYNLNDWVVIDRNQYVETDSQINPFVYFTFAEELEIYDDKPEIIVTSSPKLIEKIISEKECSNKMIYYFPSYRKEQINSIKELLVYNVFAAESQVTVNSRNIFVKDGFLSYEFKVTETFHGDVQSFIKLRQRNNNCIYMVTELEASELYTTVGINEKIDISEFAFLDNNVVEFNIIDSFKRKIIRTTLVLDLQKQEIIESVNNEFLTSEYNFDRKAYITIIGVKNKEDIKMTYKGEEIDFPFKVEGINNYNLDSNYVLYLKQRDTTQVVVKNYFHEQSRFQQNFKRIKAIDMNTKDDKLVIIYDPFDKGFINALERDEYYEVVLNAYHKIEDILEFGQAYAQKIGATAEQTYYLIDESTLKNVDIDLTEYTKANPNVILTSDRSIKNVIINRDKIYNFTNIPLIKQKERKTNVFSLQLEHDVEMNKYKVIIPRELKDCRAFYCYKFNGIENYDGVRLNDTTINLNEKFLKNVIGVKSDFEFQIALFDEEFVYYSKIIQISINDDEEIIINEKFEQTILYTTYDDVLANENTLTELSNKLNVDLRLISTNEIEQYESGIKKIFPDVIIDKTNFKYLLPYYFETLGYKRIMYISPRVILTEFINYYETDYDFINNAYYKNENNLIVNEEKNISFIFEDIRYYKAIMKLKSKYQIYAVDSGKTSLERTVETSPVIDFTHECVPWDENVNEVFAKYLNRIGNIYEKRAFLNFRLFNTYQQTNNLPTTMIKPNLLIDQNNILMNVKKFQKKLSIIITTYGNEDIIQKTLELIIKNNPLVVSDYEIRIYDDCSKDDTVRLAREYLAQFPELESSVKVNAVNMRFPGYGVNQGILEAKGRYLHIIDGDDIPINGIYEELNRKLQADVISFGHYNYDVTLKEYVKAQYYSRDEFKDQYPYKKSKDKFKMMQANVTHWNKFFRTEFLRENSIFYLENQLVQDNAFLSEVYYARPKVHHIPKMGYIYFIGQESVSSGRKGLQMVQAYTNANRKRFGVTNDLKNGYLYALRRFMTYTEVKVEQIPDSVNTFHKKFANHPDFKKPSVFGNLQMSQKIMHHLIQEKKYRAVERFLEITDFYKRYSDYHDSKLFDFYLRMYDFEQLAKFIVQSTIYLETVDQNDELMREEYIKYVNASKKKVQNEVDNLIVKAAKSGHPQIQKAIPNLVADYNAIKGKLARIEDYEFDLELDFLNDLYFGKTRKKHIIIIDSNPIFKQKLLDLDPEMKISELITDQNKEVDQHELAQIMQEIKKNGSYFIILKGDMQIDYRKFYLSYIREYSYANDYVYIKTETPDVFDFYGTAWFNSYKCELSELANLSVYRANAITDLTNNFIGEYEPAKCINLANNLRGYLNPSEELIDYLNVNLHVSKVRNLEKYEAHNELNYAVFEMNSHM